MAIRVKVTGYQASLVAHHFLEHQMEWLKWILWFVTWNVSLVQVLALLEVLFTALRCCFKRDYSPSLQIIPTIPHSQGYLHCPNINRPSPSAYVSAYTSNREGSRSHLFRKRGQGDGQANSSPGTEPRGKHLHEKGSIWLWRELL